VGMVVVLLSKLYTNGAAFLSEVNR